jgi:hypothetical protein
MPAEERPGDEGVDALGWGNADEGAEDDAVQENVEGGQVRRPDEPPEFDPEHQGEERGPGA